MTGKGQQKMVTAVAGAGDKFKYRDEGQRFIRTNRFGFICAALFYCVCVLYLVLRLIMKEAETVGLTSASIVIVVVMLAISGGAYLKASKSRYYRLIVAVTTVVVYCTVGFFTPANFVHWGLAGIMVVNLPYYDIVNTKRLAAFYGLAFLINNIYRHFTGIESLANADAISTVAVVVAVIVALVTACNIGKLFTDDMNGYMAFQKDQEAEMLDDIIDISKALKSETDKSNEYVTELYTAAQTVQHSMTEISTATEMTAENVQEQNLMTQEIQDAIEEAVTRSRAMVGVAQESNDSIHENIKAIDELKIQSESIAETNGQVNESMKKLQQKTKEVEEIAGIIFSISNQTNLLALNASIESARAGEAGRGFAVVAEQIRQLAEQTRKSTENISNIIRELNENADEVVHAVDDSMNATSRQGEMILTAADNFDKLGSNISSLIGGIHEIDTKISGLYEANNKIVENISQLSAATQEITASAEQAKELSDHNLKTAQETKDALHVIQVKTEGMEKYF